VIFPIFLFGVKVDHSLYDSFTEIEDLRIRVQKKTTRTDRDEATTQRDAP